MLTCAQQATSGMMFHGKHLHKTEKELLLLSFRLRVNKSDAYTFTFTHFLTGATDREDMKPVEESA